MKIIPGADLNLFGGIVPDSWIDIRPGEVQKSNAFLAAKPEMLFSGVDNFWNQFCSFLGRSLPSLKTTCHIGAFQKRRSKKAGLSSHLEFVPTEGTFTSCDEKDPHDYNISRYDKISHVYGFSIDESDGFIVLRNEDIICLAGAFVEKLAPDSSVFVNSDDFFKTSTTSMHIIAEYLIHRMLWSLAKSWKGSNSLEYVFKGKLVVDSITGYSGEVLHLMINFDSNRADFIVIPPKSVLSAFSASAVSSLPYYNWNSENIKNEDEIRLTAAIGRVEIDPSRLVDILRPGTVIFLGSDVRSDKALIFLNLKEEARADICRLDNLFLIRFTPSKVPEVSLQKYSGSTQITLAIVDEMVSVKSLLASPLYFLSETRTSNMILLLIGGEIVARGELGYYTEEGKGGEEPSLSIRILPQDKT
ncbi:MAG TPA: hypothetical protein PKA63_00325 [Oligoflexia bacterium]|nr:hypothetical protein [Oligoflexia bacterium]HMP47094.1 hypothetical protein [Oligoflexia bacterium]